MAKETKTTGKTGNNKDQKMDKNETGVQRDSIEYRLFYRYIMLMLIANLIGTGVNMVAHSFSIASVVNIFTFVFDLFMYWYVRKTSKIKLGLWSVLVISGALQFPVIFMVSGLTAICYFIVVVVSVSFISEDRYRVRNFVLAMVIYLVFMLTIGLKAPSMRMLPPNAIIAAFISFIMGSVTIFCLEMVFIRKYNEAQEVLVKQSKAKTDFLASMSHEIRTPINGIIGMNEMILRESSEDEVIQYAAKARSSAKILLELVNDILDISKVEEGKMEVMPVNYNLSDMLETLITLTASRAADKGLTLDWEIDENLPNRLYGDDVKLRQVAINFLTNAIKYTPSGSVKLLVSGEVMDGKLQLKVSVSDTGTGIKEENLPTLFQAFERFDDQNTRTIEGTGLGLNISYKLIKLMGGEIWAESTWGQGSTFSYTVMQDIIEDTPVGKIEKHVAENAGSLVSKKRFVAPDVKVLVVDDNRLNLEVFTNLLKRTQIQVTAVESGFACLEEVKRDTFDMIFIDHMMPEMDGLETLSRFKMLEGNLNKKTPTVALTANAISGAKEMYLSHGFDAFLTKPIMVEELERMLMEYLPENLIHDAVDDTEEEGQFSRVEITDGAGENGQRTGNKSYGGRSTNSKLPELEGFSFELTRVFFIDEESLLESLKSFKMSLPGLQSELVELYSKIDSPEAMDLARIKVHALKGQCQMLGYLSMHHIARHLEAALRSQEMTRIHGLFPVLLEELEECIQRMADLELDSSDEDSKKSMDVDAVSQLLENLKESISTFDFGAVDEQMATLKEYSFPEKLTSYVDELAGAVNDFDVDTTVRVCDQLLTSLEL